MTTHFIPEAPPEEPLPRDDAAGTAPEMHRVLRAPNAVALGRLANSPAEIPWAGWRAVLRRTLWEMLTDRVSLVAAGCAFYGTLALFPAM